jgi:four helix bundle protein
MQDFRDLKVWHRSHQIVLKIYDYTKGFPKHELYGVTSQIRRAATSMPTNIAEGSSRGSDADFARFLQIAFSSSAEVEYLLLLSLDLNYLEKTIYQNLYQELTETRRMIAALRQKLIAKS